MNFKVDHFDVGCNGGLEINDGDTETSRKMTTTGARLFPTFLPSDSFSSLMVLVVVIDIKGLMQHTGFQVSTKILYL